MKWPEKSEDQDALIAEKIMGWEIAFPYETFNRYLWKRENPPPGLTQETPRFTTDLNAAQLVVAKMRNQLLSRRQFFLQKLQEIVTSVIAPDWNIEERQVAWPDVYWFVTPEIICKAACLTMDVEIEW